MHRTDVPGVLSSCSTDPLLLAHQRRATAGEGQDDTVELFSGYADPLSATATSMPPSCGPHDTTFLPPLSVNLVAFESLAVSGAGHITNLRTTRLLTSSEAMKAMARAGGGNYKGPKGK